MCNSWVEKKSIAQQIFNVNNDQKSPKFLIKRYLVLSIKHKIKHANNGKPIIKNNINKFLKIFNKIT